MSSFLSLFGCLHSLFFLLHALDDDRCSSIDPISHKILDRDITGEFYVSGADGVDTEQYIEASKQWSYPAYTADRIHPSMIVFPKNDTDIRTVLDLARLCHYKIVVRSGGHQYDALSSCNSLLAPCIQIDMKHYTQLHITAHNHSLQVGVGNTLRSLYEFVDAHGYFLPGGEHLGLGIGGHVLTGGSGYLAKTHGLLADYVRSFDIILSNGTKLHRVGFNADQDGHRELYWAVLGGTPGSFGVITSYEFDVSTTQNTKHANCVGFVYKFAYSKSLMIAFGHLLMQLNDDKEHFLGQPQMGNFMLGFNFDVKRNDYVMKLAWIWTGNEGASQHDVDYVSQLFLSAAQQLSVAPFESRKVQTMSMSQLVMAMCADYGEMAPMPYMLRSYYMRQNIDEEFVDLFVDRIELVYKKYGKFKKSGMALIFMLNAFGRSAMYDNDPRMTKTSFAFRKQLIAFPVLVFYDTKIQRVAAKMTKKWLDDTMEILMLTKPYNYGLDDYREPSLTFGDLNLDNVWPYYYHNESAFRLLTEIKAAYDAIDLFHTSFTIPLPNNIEADAKYEL